MPIALSHRLGLIAVRFFCLMALACTLFSVQAQAAPLPVAIAVGGNNLTQLLWNNPDASLSLWKLAADGSVTTQSTYGPYSGWTGQALAAGADSVPRILWKHAPDGQLSLWHDTAGAGFTHTEFGPYTGYTAQSLAVGGDSVVRLLWAKSDGTLSLWHDVNSAPGFSHAEFGPFSGYQPALLAVGASSVPHVLWNRSDGAISLWNDVQGTGDYSHGEYGPYSGYAPLSLAVDSTGAPRLLWTGPGSTVSLWKVAINGTFTHAEYPDPAGYLPVGIACGTGGDVRLLWSNGQGDAQVWTIAAGGSYTAKTYSNGSGVPVGDLSTYATGSGRIALYWTPVVNATGYNIYRGTSAGSEDYLHPVNGSTPVNAASYPGSPMSLYSNSGLTNGTAYFYTIKAVSGSGQSQASNEDSDIPDAAAVPWDTRNPGAIISAFNAAFASDTSGIGADPFTLRVVGPDSTIYDPSSSTAQPPDGIVAPGTNQLVRPDGSTQTMPDDEGQLDSPSPAASTLSPSLVGTALQGDRGPFRRVSTRKNANGSGDYRGATGMFYLPGATVSQAAVTDHGDSPVIYLGISGSSIAVDAGLAYQQAGGMWALEMQIGGKIVSAQGDPKKFIRPVKLENAPKGSQYYRFAPGSSVIMSYWAWGTYPTKGRAKLSLLLVDSLDNSTAAALGAPSRYLLREENVRAKRVHAVAQNVAGVFPTGTTINAASWSQGSVFLPDAAGSTQGWSSAAGTLPGEDGSYEGGKSDVNANRTSPFIQEDGITIVIHTPSSAP